jgi:hypothetical protein
VPAHDHHVHVLGLPLGSFIAWAASIGVVSWLAVVATKIFRSATVIVLLAGIVLAALWLLLRYAV